MVTQAIQKIISTKLYREAEAEATAQIQAGREAAVKELDKITAAHIKGIPARNAKREEARAKVAEAEAILKAARLQHGEAEAEIRRASLGFDRAKGQLERQLRETAPECISEFIEELDNLAEWTREHYRPTKTVEVTHGSRRALEPVLDRDAINARLESIKTARQGAEALKLSADPDINQQIEGLRAGLGL